MCRNVVNKKRFDQTRFDHWSVAGMSEVNIALGKPAYMSSWHASTNVASSGNDGNHGTIFITNRGSLAWWAVDFGQERARITRVRVTNILSELYRGKCLKCLYDEPIYTTTLCVLIL